LIEYLDPQNADEVLQGLKQDNVNSPIVIYKKLSKFILGYSLIGIFYIVSAKEGFEPWS
jgi:hypothetical protein